MGLFNRAGRNSASDSRSDVENRNRSASSEWGMDSSPAPEPAEPPVAEVPAEPVHESTPEPGTRPEEEAPMSEKPESTEPQSSDEQSPEQETYSFEPAGSDAVPMPVAKPGVADELHKVEGGDSAPEIKVTREPEPEEPPRLTAQEALAPSRVRSEDPGGDEAGEGRRAKVISFANQKGGVAKTTTTLNLAVAFAEQGLRALVIDLDPQGNLTMSQGIDPDKVEKSMYDVLVTHMPLSEVIQHREIDVAVSSIDLAGAEIAMSTQIGRERSLEKAIKAVAYDYDYICIDTPPSLGLLTINALTASDSVIVPVQCEYLSMRGLMQLQNTLEMIRDNLNPKVVIEGILPTMLDTRTVHAKEAVAILEENFGDLVFNSRIRKAIKFAEAPVRGSSLLKYDPKSNAADYYRDLAKEVLAKEIVTNGAS
jgi:chromosome partitioning protein